jgi:hypothetical protein
VSDELFVLLLLLAVCGWFGFCALMNHWAITPTIPAATDPGAEARAALTAPQPMPTGRHRNPASPLTPFTYRPLHTTGDHRA